MNIKRAFENPSNGTQECEEENFQFIGKTMKESIKNQEIPFR
jgi:hypothetical protein